MVFVTARWYFACGHPSPVSDKRLSAQLDRFLSPAVHISCDFAGICSADHSVRHYRVVAVFNYDLLLPVVLCAEAFPIKANDYTSKWASVWICRPGP